MPSPRYLLVVSIVVVLTALLGGCEVTEDWWRMPGSTERPEPAGSNRSGVVEIDAYLDTMLLLAEGDLIDQAEIFGRVERANNVSPTTTNRLMYALALSTPGHPNSNPREAQLLLSELLATPENMVTDEHTLAEIQLLHTERYLVLQSESARLQGDAQQLARQQQSSSSRRLRALQTENKQLKDALDEANEKLDAISLIERTIIDTPTTGQDPNNTP